MTVSIDQPATDAVTATLLAFLAGRTRQTWRADEDLFASGAVSSLFAMELVVYLEKEFGVTLGGDDLTLDNFRSVEAMAALVGRLRGPGDAGA
jgi:methoxymalonate biosynthesis acyl carrier protein